MKKKKVLFFVKDIFAKTIAEVTKSWGYEISTLNSVNNGVCEIDSEVIIIKDDNPGSIPNLKIAEDCEASFIRLSESTQTPAHEAGLIVLPLSIVVIQQVLQVLLA